MSNLDLTRDWLQNVLRPYPSRDKILSETMAILQARRTLSVKTDAFTFDTGHTALLLLLHGTLPISFRGATYHIPVHIWIPHEYPRAAPLAFVVPTKDMGVRKGREVDPGGRVKEEIVEHWWAGWPDRNIEMLIKQLVSIFSAVPPVYAKPPDAASPAIGRNSPGPSTASPRPESYGQASSSTQPPPPPARPGYGPPLQTESLPQYRPAPTPPGGPPYPASHSRQASASYRHSPSTSHPGPPQSPPVPNRPQQAGYRQQPLPPSSPTGPNLPQRPYQPQIAGPAYDQRAVTPPRPAPQAQYPNQGYQDQNQQYPPSGYQAGPPPVPHHPPHPQSHQQYAPLQPQAQHAASPQPAQYAPAQQPQQGQYAQHAQPAAHAPPAQAAPTRRIVQDLMSSPPDHPISLPEPVTNTNPLSPPPVPPSKPPPPSLLHLHAILLPHLNASLPPLVHSLQANRQHLLERKEDLSSGEPAIRDEMARLEAVKKVCDSVGRKMDDVVARGEERVVELEQKGEISVDEVVCGISIVHNQLIDLVAEDNAIEDTIYHMTRALDAERIDLDRFLKSIRSLAREQYTKRAMIERILHGMGQTQGW